MAKDQELKLSDFGYEEDEALIFIKAVENGVYYSSMHLEKDEMVL